MSELTITITDTITVGDLASALNIPVSHLIGELFKNGIVATINQRLDLETAQIIVEELGLSVELKAADSKNSTAQVGQGTKVVDDGSFRGRPPIVAIMGHVDHGKTSLLDAILNAKVATGEAGGITQHIAAYQTKYDGRVITLLDTPGHEAFSALRQHGAYLTDVVVIVVAADDGIKPQTVEAINFARNAKAQIVVAVNKTDKPEADINRVKQQLTEYDLIPEEWGGDTVVVEVSAKTKQGLDKLLEMILLVADLNELKASYDRPAEGLVIEAHQEQGRGSTVNLLVAHGQLTRGQYLVAGSSYGKIRTLRDWRGKNIKEAGPSTPVEITGMKELPDFAQNFKVVATDKGARVMAKDYSGDASSQRDNVSSQEILRMISRKHETIEVPIVIKADVQGSLTSVMDSLKLLEIEEVRLNIISSGVGNITEGDVQTANIAGAVIYGFNVAMPTAVQRIAKHHGVEFRKYDVIYKLIDDARLLLAQHLTPETIETEVGRVLIKGIFRTTKDEVVCGGEVTVGRAIPGVLAKVVRGKDEIDEVEVVSVKRQQQEAKEVFQGELCGLQLKTKSKLVLQEGDKIEMFTREVRKREL